MESNSFNLVEHYKNISNHLFSQYLLSSSYGHRGSKGQIREDFMTKTLQEMAHDYIKLKNGEICDSKGRRSSEFDIIVSYLSNTIRLFGSGITNVIPVETVLSVIEVKSILSMDGIGKFNNDIKSLNSFERFYSILYRGLKSNKGLQNLQLFSNPNFGSRH